MSETTLKRIFVSSSGDLKVARKKLYRKLNNWLITHDLDNMIQPYLWEHETQNGMTLSDRVSFQEQLISTFNKSVPFTVAMFGERCGVNLQDGLSDDLLTPLKKWRTGGDYCLKHPWPKKNKEIQNALDGGFFPLTGTTFEVISAIENDDAELFFGYVANKGIEFNTQHTGLLFNERKHFKAETFGLGSDDETNKFRQQDYDLQIKALLNFLKAVMDRKGALQRYETEEEMADDLFNRTQCKLRSWLDTKPNINPFKRSLSHWRMDDERQLPGRRKIIGDIATKVLSDVKSDKPLFYLLEGPSGCGKSSVLEGGVLKELKSRKKDNTLVLSVRPSDLANLDGNKQPLELLWLEICDVYPKFNRNEVQQANFSGQAEIMGKTMSAQLSDTNKKFVLGLDQFEEILDELYQDKDKKDQAQGWWQVMHFLKEMLKYPDFVLIGTLESLRKDTFKTLEIEDFLNVLPFSYDISMSAEIVGNIAATGFNAGGLPIADDLLVAIKEAWTKFVKEQEAHKISSSPLPLLGLWLANLYDRFDHLADNAKDTGASKDFSKTAGKSKDKRQLELADMDNEEIRFDDLIADMAKEAWTDAGGVLEKDKTPQDAALNSFLQPLVSVNDDRQIRLLPAPTTVGVSTQDSVISKFYDQRLLVPAGSDTVRLVHQAVIDRWPPAAKWFESRSEYLNIEKSFRLLAKVWHDEDRPDLKISTTEFQEKIQKAVQILNENVANWSMKTDQQLGVEAALLKAYALAVFEHATTPLTEVENSTGGNCFANVAAMYGLIDLLEKFISSKHEPLVPKSELGDTIIHSAAWVDDKTVAFLIKKGFDPKAPGKLLGWHPIAAAVQRHNHEIFKLLIKYYDDANPVIGPNELTLITDAARYGNTSVIDHLLDRQADPLKTDKFNRTAIHYAALGGQLSAFKRLEPYVDMRYQDDYRYTALHYATNWGHDSILRWLVNGALASTPEVKSALKLKNNRSMTPIMEAAFNKRHKALSVLLKHENCKPLDHIMKNQQTLLHLAVKEVPDRPIGPDQKIKARQTVELLLEHDDIDPMDKDADGNTAYDLAAKFPEALQIIRKDPKFNTSYESLSEQMRLDDLRSLKSSVTWALISRFPQVLTDKHKGEMGFGVLFACDKIDVIQDVLNKGLIKPDLIRTYLPFLLDSALRKGERALIKKLISLGADRVLGSKDTKPTLFHELAINGKLKEFEKLAQHYHLFLPRDDWGRIPSDLAADAKRLAFAALEQKHFKQQDKIEVIQKSLDEELIKPDKMSLPFLLDSALRKGEGAQIKKLIALGADRVLGSNDQKRTLFHELAIKGELDEFEKLAQYSHSHLFLPRDDWGRIPSDLAADAKRLAFAALEQKHFKQEETT